MIKIEKTKEKYIFKIQNVMNSFKFYATFDALDRVNTFHILEFHLENKQKYMSLSNNPFNDIDSLFDCYSFSEIESLVIFKKYQQSILNFINANKDKIVSTFKSDSLVEIFKKTLENCNK